MTVVRALPQVPQAHTYLPYNRGEASPRPPNRSLQVPSAMAYEPATGTLVLTRIRDNVRSQVTCTTNSR
eukprot:6021-Rhodomonas_salina.1